MINKVNSWPPVAINHGWFIRDDGFLDSFNSIFVLIPLLVICKSGSDRTVYFQVVFYIKRLVFFKSYMGHFDSGGLERA